MKTRTYPICLSCGRDYHGDGMCPECDQKQHEQDTALLARAVELVADAADCRGALRLTEDQAAVLLNALSWRTVLGGPVRAEID